MTQTSVKRKGHGVLRVVAGLLLMSAVLRAIVESGPVLAQTSNAAQPSTPKPEVQDAGTFLAALQERENQLGIREAALTARADAMQEAQAKLDEKLAELIAVEEALSATIAMAESASATDVAQLTTVYENMKPKEAAALFEEMSPDFAAGFLALMRPDVAASIMSELEPETAYSFSVVLAGRNANTPTQ